MGEVIEKKEEPKKAVKKPLSLYAIGRGRRGKKKEQAEKGKKKKSGGFVRAQSDLGDLELPHNVKLTLPNKENLQTFKVSVVPDTGYWKGATYIFDFKIPDNYPIVPPKVKCDTKIYHPNIDLQGNVCLNLLKADWRPILTVQQVIHGLIFLFLEPNPADPLNQDAAEVFRNNINVFRQNVNKSLAGGYVGGTSFPKMNLKKY